MPWRLIVFIVIFAISLTFIMFNLGNRCDIDFVFKKFEAVPIFLTIFASFFLGMLCILPFTIGVRRKRKDKQVTDDEPEQKPQKPRKIWGKKKDSADSPVSGGGSDGVDLP